jgi:hypothetical protein
MYRKHPPVSGGKRTGTVRPGRASCFQATPEVSAAALACPVRVPSRSGGQGARLDGPDRRLIADMIADAGAERRPLGLFVCVRTVRALPLPVSCLDVENRLR